MTLSTSTNVATSTGNGVTVAFSIPFTFYENSHIVVTVDGVTKVLDTDYTLTGAGVDGGGTVTFIVAPANGTEVVRTRTVPYIQETDFENFDGNPADVTEKQFDLCVMQTQQLVEFQDRSIHYPIGDIASSELPNAASRASKYLAFDADGEPVVMDGTDGTPITLPLAIEQGGTGAITVTAARAALVAAKSGANTDILTIYLQNTGLKIEDTNASHGLIIKPNSDLTANRTLSIVTGDADRSLTLGGDVSIDGVATQAQVEAASSATTFISPSNIKYGVGVAKAGGTVTFSGGATPTLSAGSFGVTSITDSGVGVTTINLSVTFSSTNYQVLISPRAIAAGGCHADTRATTSFVIKTFSESGGSFPAADIDFDFVVFGDLA